MTQHQGACSRGGGREGFSPRHGCCVQARDKICDPAQGGVLEGGGLERVSPPGTAAVSKHETGTVTKQPTGARGGGSGEVSLPGTAAVSKHETSTVTKQTTGALKFMVAFPLRGGGRGQLLREYISLRCALGGGRSGPAKSSTPLANTSEHDTPLLCQPPAVPKHDKGYCVKARDRLLSQSTRHMLGQTNRHTAVIKARDTCCVKARDTLLCQTTRHTTVSKHDVGAVTHTVAVKHCCSVTAQHTKP